MTDAVSERPAQKVGDALLRRQSGVAFEFFPPKTPKGMESLKRAVLELDSYDPIYYSVTYGAGGSTQERTEETLYALRDETGSPLMAHLTCVGARREALDALLRRLMARGIDNILALRGDRPHDMYEFDRINGDLDYASDLVEFIQPFEHFGISVAVYPEGHPEAPSLEVDIANTKKKVAAGADFAITQMFFDNSYLYDYLDKAHKAGIDIPVFAGIMPVADYAKVRKFAGFCQATIPPALEELMGPVMDDPDESFKRAIEFSVRQCEDLISNGVRYMHFYTLNKPRATMAILDALGLRAP